MSDVGAAAAAMNIPEDLVQRSAAARAAAGGSSTDDIIAAWAGGTAAPAAEPGPAEADAPAETDGQAETETSAEPEAEPEPAPADTPAPAASSRPEAVDLPAPVASSPGQPPILEGRTERPFLIAAGAGTLLVVAMLVGFLAPALPQEGNGVYTSSVALTQAGLDGRDVYRSEGCAACHTQTVRPVVADVELGPVTISDSNQILGVRRYGPDLTHVGDRYKSQSSLLPVLTGASNHPSYAGLSDTDLENLTAYLFGSK